MKRRKVSWHLSATADVDAIVEHLVAADSALNAERVVDGLEAAATSLGQSAMSGRVVPELAAYGIQSYRELVEPPWRMVYRVEAKEVLILTIVDSRRQLDELLLERLIRAS